jgi:predicted P-loop ATPase
MKELPNGFITKKNGEASHQTIQVGDLLGLLQDTYGKELELNLMSGEPEINRQPIANASVENFYVILSKLGYKINKTPARDGLMTAAQCNSYHPVEDEFHRIELDDTIYPIDLDQVATDYLGTSDSLYDAMLATTLIGLVNRTFHHGCKFDTCLVLTGKEGIRKSTFWKELATENWFCDTWQKKDQDLFMAINQTLIYEFAELDGITGVRAQASMKAVLSSATDTYKRPYATGIGKFPRPSILVATSNRCDFLSDPSADHRRFWVIPLANKELDTGKVKQDRERIIKAAIIAYRNGRKPFLKKELQDESNRRNKNFQAEHPFMDKLSDWVKTRDNFSTEEALIGSRCRSDESARSNDFKEAANCLRALGYQKDTTQTRINGSRKYLWRKI